MHHNGGMCLQLTNSTIGFPLRVAASYNDVMYNATRSYYTLLRSVYFLGEMPASLLSLGLQAYALPLHSDLNLP